MNRKYAEKTIGSVMDFMTVGMTLLAVVVVVTAAFCSMEFMIKKLEVSQVARKYILVMETKGCLTEDVRQQLLGDLNHLGMKEIDISGTTMQPVEYGNTIILSVRGKIRGEELVLGNNLWTSGFGIQEYYVEEIRMSTAKN